MSNAANDALIFCARCNRGVAREDAVNLWDGRCYCEECITGCSDRIAEYRMDHQCLEDTVTFNDGVLWRLYLVLWLISMFIVFIVVVAIQPSQETIAIIVLLGMSMPIIHFCTSLMTLPQTIRIADGIVKVSMPWRVCRFRFDDCVWRVDARLEDKVWYPMSRWVSMTPAIVLEVSEFGSRHAFYACVDEETRKLWGEFLTFASGNLRRTQQAEAGG